LALEQGDTDVARSALINAQELCGQTWGAAVQFAGAPIAIGYLGKLTR